ncbi:MAG: hypothetical protein HDS68_06680 [Bacteroidales bacterium]|nr:hypothetical protein [Bacteroidales bacterium]
MIRPRKLQLMLIAGTLVASGCSSQKQTAVHDASTGASARISDTSDRGAIIRSEQRFDKQIVRDGGSPGAVSAMPKAVAYRMSGDYADNVAIALTADGESILSYPAPTDLGKDSPPVSLGGGWWLSRCGISANSVFTTYTYATYSALKQAPSPEELLKAVIPGARVTRIERLSMTPQQALADTAAVCAELRALAPAMELPK